MSRGLLPALSPVLLSAFFLIFSPSSHAVYKCTQQDTISYSDQPCSGSQLELAAPPPARPPDRATELQREKADVARMQNARELMERQDQTFRTMSLRGEAAKKKKCNALALQRKWKEEDVHLATPSTQIKARRNARRASEKYQSECSDLPLP